VNLDFLGIIFQQFWILIAVINIVAASEELLLFEGNCYDYGCDTQNVVFCRDFCVVRDLGLEIGKMRKYAENWAKKKIKEKLSKKEKDRLFLGLL
jgi:uncharacterized metal-binding protein